MINVGRKVRKRYISTRGWVHFTSKGVNKIYPNLFLYTYHYVYVDRSRSVGLYVLKDNNMTNLVDALSYILENLLPQLTTHPV